MTDNFMDLESFMELVRNSGLNVKKDSDMKLWQQALDEYDGNDINADLPLILARAASKKPGVEILQDWNDAHQPEDTNRIAPMNLDDTPQANRSGFDILEDYNREHPL